MSSRPKIGITSRSDIATSQEAVSSYLSYARAVENAGGEPICLDPVKCAADDPSDILRELDGMLFSGGVDIHPRHFDPAKADLDKETLKARYNMEVDDWRDNFELPLARQTILTGLPTLGICRGFQLLNVAYGGGLVMDIHSNIHHKSREGGESEQHPVRIPNGTRLHALLEQDCAVVNSRHHQGITEVEKSERLTTAAVAKDGIIEAVESADHPWLTAVQWHPERDADACIRESGTRIFRAFIEAAQSKQG